ncbi:hypothetical protein CIB48_g1798 [Xylaria polymorpha]|nr:hypothetical protein CIB48_g1798 [Xylaria polymorpha]
MAPGQKMYPRATVKKIVKAHSKCNVSKNVDVMIFLDYVLFMQTLVKEAAIDSKQAGERNISAKSIRKATPTRRTKRLNPLHSMHPDRTRPNATERDRTRPSTSNARCELHSQYKSSETSNVNTMNISLLTRSDGDTAGLVDRCI